MFKKFGSFFKIDNNNIKNYAHNNYYVEDNPQMVNTHISENEELNNKKSVNQNQQITYDKTNDDKSAQMVHLNYDNSKLNEKVNYSDYAIKENQQNTYHDFISRHRRLSSEIDKNI